MDKRKPCKETEGLCEGQSADRREGRLTMESKQAIFVRATKPPLAWTCPHLDAAPFGVCVCVV